MSNYQKSKREGFMTSREVAARLQVTEWTVRNWRNKEIFVEDMQDHNGVYWYSIERVEQLKSVYWKTAYTEKNTTNFTFPDDPRKDECKKHLADYLTQLGIDFSKNFHCLNPQHQDDTPSMTFYPDSNCVYCHGCGEIADIFRVYSWINNIPETDKRLFQEVFDKFSYSLPPSTLHTTHKPKKPINYSGFLKYASSHILDTNYWSTVRHLSESTVKHFNIGFSPKWRHPSIPSRVPASDKPFHPALIIPTGDCIHHYTARLIDSDGPNKCMNVGSSSLFNLSAINEPIIFLVEGEIDSMSLFQLGFNSLALGGVSNKKLFIDLIRDLKTKPKAVILALDNDEPGLLASKWLQQFLSYIPIPSFICNHLFSPFKDPNDMFIHEPDSLKSALLNQLSLVNSHFSNTQSAEITNKDKSFEASLASLNLALDRFSTIDQQLYDSEVLASTFLDSLILASSFDRKMIFSANTLYSAAICRKSSVGSEVFSNFIFHCSTHGISKKDLEDQIIVFYKEIKSVKKHIAATKKELETQKAQLLFQQQCSSNTDKLFRSDQQWPIKLLLPEGYTFTDKGGIVEQRLIGDRIVSLPVSYSYILITKKFINLDSKLEKLEVCCLNHDNKQWRFICAERNIFADSRKIISLASLGLDVTSEFAKPLVTFLKKLESVNVGKIPSIFTVRQPGWRGDDFVYPNSPGTFSLDKELNSQMEKTFTTSGSLDLTLALLDKVRSISPLASISIGIALASPLVRILGIRNIVAHLWAKTGSGKTALALFLYSLFANPSSFSNFNSTLVAFERLFASHNDLLCFIDELQSAKGKSQIEAAKGVPFLFGNGFGRSRGNKYGGTDDLLYWKGCLITTGEQPLTDDFSNGGAKNRTIELTSNTILPDSLCQEIYRFTRSNYGLIGRPWVDFIKAHKQQICATYEKILYDPESGYLKQYSHKIPGQVQAIAAAETANLFFFICFKNLSEAEKVEQEEQIRREGASALSVLPDSVSITDSLRAKYLIIDWINSHPKQFRQPTLTEGVEVEAEAYETYGVDRKGFYGVYKLHLANMLRSNGFSPEKILKELADDGFIKREGKNIESKISVKGKYQRMIKIEKEAEE